MDAIYGQLPGGEGVLEKGKRLLEEGDEAEAEAVVFQLPLQPHGEDLWLHLAIDQKLRKKKADKGKEGQIVP